MESELAVLEYLMAAGRRVVPAEELLERVWDEAADPFTATVKVTVGRLRAKLSCSPSATCSSRRQLTPSPCQAAVISIALGWLVAGRVLRPVRTISANARRIGASNLNERLRLDGPDDEFRELAVTLNGLLGRLQASFDSQRRFIASARQHQPVSPPAPPASLPTT